MKTKLLLFAMTFCFVHVNAQETEEPVQKNQFNFYRNFREDFSRNKNNSDITKIDYTFGYERKINKEVSIGINLNYFESNPYLFNETKNGVVTNTSNLNDSSIGLNVSLNYDWSKMLGLNTNKFDIYTGTNFGASHFKSYNTFITYYDENVEEKIYQNNNTKFFIGGKLGFRYWITKSIGVTTELDQGFYSSKGFYAEPKQKSKLNIGLNYKF